MTFQRHGSADFEGRRQIPGSGGATRAAAVLLICAFAVVPAADAKIKISRDPGADLSKLQTYAWRHTGREIAPDLGDAIRPAADEVLAGKGLRLVAEAPDAWLEYRAGSIDSLYADWKLTSWWGFPFWVPGARSTVQAGLLIVVVDAATDEPVWTGTAVLAGNTPNALQVMRNRAPKEARKIVKKYPALKR